MAIIKLLDNVSGTGTFTGDAKSGDGGDKVLTAYGNFGGGTITVEVSDINDSNWVPVTLNGSPVSITTPIALYLRKVAQPQRIRAKLTGATSASGVNVVISN